MRSNFGIFASQKKVVSVPQSLVVYNTITLDYSVITKSATGLLYNTTTQPLASIPIVVNLSSRYGILINVSIIKMIIFCNI